VDFNGAPRPEQFYRPFGGLAIFCLLLGGSAAQDFLARYIASAGRLLDFEVMMRRAFQERTSA
jgi:hypothetical protein